LPFETKAYARGRKVAERRMRLKYDVGRQPANVEARNPALPG
jgi:hypothetical protein